MVPAHGEPVVHYSSGDDAGDSSVAQALCPNCGRINKPNERFCVDCGQDLSAALKRGSIEREPAPYITPSGEKGLLANRALVIGVAIAVVLAVAALVYWYTQQRPH